MWATERFAIDFMQLRPNGLLTDGPPSLLESYPFFGDPVLSATRGRVVGVVDGIPETPALTLPPDVRAKDAGGNHVVVRIDRGHYALYAHLQPGSIRVEAGDRVRVGQRIGSLGSTGNSNAPHLHFHVMDGPSPLGANGVPFRFERFGLRGRLQNLMPLFEGATAEVSSPPSGPRRAALPLNLQVIDFPP